MVKVKRRVWVPALKYYRYEREIANDNRIYSDLKKHKRIYRYDKFNRSDHIQIKPGFHRGQKVLITKKPISFCGTPHQTIGYIYDNASRDSTYKHFLYLVLVEGSKLKDPLLLCYEDELKLYDNKVYPKGKSWGKSYLANLSD